MSALPWPSLVGSNLAGNNVVAAPPLESETFGPSVYLPKDLSRSRLRRWTHWLPVLFFVGVLAIESTALLSSQHTSGPLHRLLSLTFGSQVDEDWSMLHHLIRKTGHFVGYGIFGLLCRRAWKRSRHLWLERGATPRVAPWLIVSPAAFGILATVVAASADELHQHFVPGRTGALRDVLLDASGAIAMQLCRVALGLLRRSCGEWESEGLGDSPGAIPLTHNRAF